ncbi:hypothetical protein LPUS_02827 [Lasallia pustulata]|uniref:Uncharacterized protein n=1 Tax=Lasallia pustulata TaxID=136370 RepID=A0A1W5CTS6_9LECA|nr:hypothetical protein LPUS_02827 [Lasallia pustulata]
MKRKFSFKLAPIKVPTDNEEEYTMVDVDSPQFSPVSFIIERPRLSPQTYLDLQRSCASIVQEVQPLDHQVYETVAASNKIPRKWSDDNQAYKTITQAPNPKSKTHRRTDSGPSLAPKPYTHIPTNAATSFTATATSRKPSYALEPPSPAFPSPPTTTTRTKPLTQPLPDPSHDPLALIRADLSTRPKTSAAACIDYQTPPSTTTTTTTTTSTSKSTTRSNTTYDAPPVANTSTGLTSLSLTPYSSRLSSSHPFPPSTSTAAAATAKAWMAQELARRRSSAEKASALLQPRSPQPPPPSSGALPPRPSARGSVSEPGPHRDDPERAVRSRNNSISQGIREYIRPRASVDSLRTSHSSSDLVAGAGAHGVSAGMVPGSFEERMCKREAREQRMVVEPKLQHIHPLLRPQRGAFLTGEGEVEGGKKGGLRKKLSRFWGRAGAKELPVAVVAN